jgi:hypothetical protein
VQCPKCDLEQPPGDDCLRCGIVFAKWNRQRAVPPPLPVYRPVELELEDEVEDGRIGPTEWKILGAGLAAAIVISLIPFLRFVFSLIVTLFHELGHAVVAWLLGHPALPAFDFFYGGGITHMGGFRMPLALLVGGLFLGAGWLFRENRKSVAIIAALFLIWLLFVTAEWRREIAIAAAGHLFEFILAGIFLYKALSGAGLRAPEWERPIAAFVAFFVQIQTMLFTWKLISDSAFLAEYGQGKGGALMHDLEVIALELTIRFGMQPGIEGMARLMLLFAFVPFGVALTWYFRRARWHRLLRALRTVDA